MNVRASTPRVPKHKSKIRLLALIGTVICGTLSFATTSLSQEEDFTAVVQGRQSNLRDLGAAFKGVADELKSDTPKLPLLRQYAHQIKELSEQQRFWFPPGSGPESEIDTKAKDEIWTRPEAFAKAQAGFAEAAMRLAETADTGELDPIRSAYKSLGKTCQTCHQTFREKED